MIKYVGLTKDGQSFVAGQPPQLDSMIGDINGDHVYLHYWTVGALDPDTGQIVTAKASECIDRYVVFNGDAYIFTALNVQYTKRMSNVFNWSLNPKADGVWWMAEPGILWPPAGATEPEPPEPTAPITTLSNVWLSNPAQLWISNTPGSMSIPSTQQFQIPGVEGTITLGQYSYPVTNPVTGLVQQFVAQEFVDYVVQVEGTYYVFMGLHFTDGVTADITWGPNGRLTTLYDKVSGEINLTLGTEIQPLSTWTVPMPGSP